MPEHAHPAETADAPDVEAVPLDPPPDWQPEGGYDAAADLVVDGHPADREVTR